MRHNLCLKKDFYYNCVRFLFNRVLGEKKETRKKKPRNISKSTLIQIIVDLLLRSKKPTKFLRIRDLVVVLPCLSRRLVQSTGKKYVALYWKFWNCWFLKIKVFSLTNEIFAYTRPCSSFTMLESSFSTIHRQKICSFVLEILKLLVFKIKVFSLTLLLANISTQKIKKTFRFPTLWKFEFLLTLFLN